MQAPEGIQTTSATSFPYRECIGALWYLVVHTRPDLAQSVGYLSRFVAAPTDQHTTELKRLLRYLRGTVNLGLRFDSKCLQPPVLVSYTDSDYGGDKNDYKSTVASWPCSSQEVTSMFSTGTVVNKLLSLALAVSPSYCARPSFGRAALVAWSPNGT